MASKTTGKTKAGGRALVEKLREAAAMCGTDEVMWLHFLKGLPAPIRRALFEQWLWQAHGGQSAPAGDWSVWLLMAGRGFGKTRAGAEWVSQMARDNPKARIALVGASRDDVIKVMIEGPSGLIRVARAGERVTWSKTNGTLRFASGAQAFVYSAEAAEGLRGPEHDFAWADELGKWPAARGDAAWDNLMMGLRQGDVQRTVVTTTPRTTALVKRVKALKGTAVTGGRTDENAHLPQAFISWMQATYGGTRLGRQELNGEMIEDVEGSLFPRALIEQCRAAKVAAADCGAAMTRVVVGVDPPASTKGTCGIVVCGVAHDGRFHVLADESIGGVTPERWARSVAAAAERWAADRVVAEKNMGGDMVASVLNGADIALPLKLVSASRGKVARAEPVAALFEADRARIAGRFPELEDELAGMSVGGEASSDGRSPDRADACVWAMSALMEARKEPKLRFI